MSGLHALPFCDFRLHTHSLKHFATVQLSGSSKTLSAPLLFKFLHPMAKAKTGHARNKGQADPHFLWYKKKQRKEKTAHKKTASQ
mmetsp:Transcript_3100/g.6348  ORF Transcript_3100/g.6348 Transcript_3100/m.6348 type:complete len:85 (+) Transcript_3100:219-473(+)